MNRYAMRWPLQEEAKSEVADAGGGGEDNNKSDNNAEPTVEDRARRMGWVPQEEFRGDKAKWTDAATFVKNGEESLPILRERLRNADRTIADLTKTAAEFKKMSDTAFERAYKKAKADLKAEIKDAGKEGDEKRVEEATEELAELEREKVKREAVAEQDPVFDGWVSANQWYQDPELRVEAETIAWKLRRKGDKTDGVAFLDKVKDEMKKAFPEKFGNPRRSAGSHVERPAGGGEGGGGSKKGWEHLPSDAKEAGERYVKQKIFKDKAEYAASYWAQN